MRENRTKRLIGEGKIAVGTSITVLAGRALPKLLEHAGLDWVKIDMQSSGFGIDAVADLLMWFKTTAITTIVRPPDNLPHSIQAVLDAGADAVQCASIATAEEARAIVDAAKYPPLGNRGVSLPSAGNDFVRPRSGGLPAELAAANAQTWVIPMIESEAGLARVDEIAAVEGVDALSIGALDLSVALGTPGDYGHPEYKTAVRRISEACRRHGKALQVNSVRDEDVREFYDLGFRLIGVRSLLNTLQDAMKANADRVREALA